MTEEEHIELLSKHKILRYRGLYPKSNFIILVTDFNAKTGVMIKTADDYDDDYRFLMNFTGYNWLTQPFLWNPYEKDVTIVSEKNKQNHYLCEFCKKADVVKVNDYYSCHECDSTYDVTKYDR